MTQRTHWIGRVSFPVLCFGAGGLGAVAPKDFREAVLKVVNLGDDADTTGAVCGQWAGAYWGESGIPAVWLEGLARKDMIQQALTGLSEELQ